MTTIAEPRKSYSIHDYPEHLNPFHEEDNHNKIRFWTIGRKLNRSNSLTFSGLKDLKNSWAFRSFMKKGKKREQKEKLSNGNGENSPIVYRRALQYSSTSSSGAPRSTVASPERYEYRGSITPLPRSRFQERLRSSSQYEVNSLSVTPRMARSEVGGSQLSVNSTNPFDDEPVAPMRARRKKKRAPLPPSAVPVADVSVTSENSEITHNETNESHLSNEMELGTEDINYNIELKIVEDEDLAKDTNNKIDAENEAPDNTIETSAIENKTNIDSTINSDNEVKVPDSENDNETTPFPKVDIVKYRRNSSVNEDDIKLRRGNLEDFHVLTNKRSKSLTNALNGDYTTYDINLNEEKVIKDPNGNKEPQKVTCKVYEETSKKQSVETISSTEKEFMEIDKATRELEREISKLNSALNEEEGLTEIGARVSVSDIRRRFDNIPSSPNPIPKPRRSHYGEPTSPVLTTFNNNV